MNTHLLPSKPSIFTESDQIISELKKELSALHNRMEDVENEQVENRKVIDSFINSQKVTNEKLLQHEENEAFHNEKYHAIAHMMNHLKQPVNHVVKNLNHFVEEIADTELQNTLKDCIQTANTVLDSFTETETFCAKQYHQKEQTQIKVDIKPFLKNLLLSFDAPKGTFHLQMDKKLPKEILFDVDLVKEALQTFISSFLSINLDQEMIFIKVFKDQKLTFRIQSEILKKIEWQESWLSSMKSFEKLQGTFPLNWLQAKENVKQMNGDIQIHKKNHHIEWVDVCFPV